MIADLQHAFFAGPTSFWFFVAVMSVVALSVITRSVDAMALSGYLLFAWGITKAIAFVSSLSIAYKFYPLTDLVGMAFVMTVWWRKPEAWKLGIGFAILTKIFLHVRFWVFIPYTKEALHNYLLALNILFAIEILCVSIAGGKVVGGYLSDRLFAGGPGHHGRRLASRRRPPDETT